MKSDSLDEDSEQYLREACYYLRKKGLSFEELSRILEMPEDRVLTFYEEYRSQLGKGLVSENDADKALWEDVYNDSMGNEKITFVRDNGFYHCRKSDLEKMQSDALMSIFETSKRFLDFDMYRSYLDSKPPVGYDPMAMQRQIKKAVEIISGILETRYTIDRAKANPP